MDDNIIIHSTLDEGYDFMITDKWGKKYHFKISTFEVPSGFLSEAMEVIDNQEDEPRIYHILSDFDVDTEKSESLLKAKIKKGVNKRYLRVENGQYMINKNLKLAGRILFDGKLKNSQFDCYFQIDGKKISMEQFVDLLECTAGWNFKFQIIDTTQEVD